MILNESEIKKLNSLIVEAEKTTTGEIVPVIVNQSDDYPGARWRLSIATALLTGLILVLVYPQLESYLLLWSFIPSLFLGYLLGRSSFALRRFMNPAKIEEEVMQRAFQAFYEHGLGTTANQTGILIFISLNEHKVVVLADRGIHQKVEASTWDLLVKDLVAEIKNKSLFEGLSQAITHAGKILSTHFPGDHTNTNELPNQIFIEN